MSIKVENLDGVLQSLEELEDTTQIGEILTRACLLVERSAKQRAPKGTGELRRSIESKVEGLEGTVFTPLEYAPYVEYGTGLFAENGGRTDVPWRYKDDEGKWHTTSGRKPHPYMRPALNENRNKILDLFKEGLTK